MISFHIYRIKLNKMETNTNTMINKVKLNELDILTIKAKIYFLNKHERSVRQTDELWTLNTQIAEWNKDIKNGWLLNDEYEHIKFLQTDRDGAYVKAYLQTIKK